MAVGRVDEFPTCRTVRTLHKVGVYGVSDVGVHPKSEQLNEITFACAVPLLSAAVPPGSSRINSFSSLRLSARQPQLLPEEENLHVD